MTQGKIVSKVSPEVMDGKSILEKQLNAYLTSNFICSRDIPSDECLSEAKHLVTWNKETNNFDIYDYLVSRFHPTVPRDGYSKATSDILEMINFRRRPLEKRPSNYSSLSPEDQWMIDKELGLLDYIP